MRTRLRKSIGRSLPASLKARMSVIVFLLVLGAVALLSLATLAVAERGILVVTSAQQDVSLASAAVFVDKEMAAKRSVLRVMADSIAAQNIETVAGLQRFLAAQTMPGTEFFMTGVMGRDGSALASRGPVTPQPGATVRDRQYFIDTLLQKRSVISSPLQGSMTGMPLVVITEPVFDAFGQVRLVLVASVNLRQPDFLGRLDMLRPGPGGYLYITTQEGVVIEHPDKSRIMQHIGALPAPGSWASMRGKAGNGDDALLAYRRIASTGWIMGSVYPLRDAFAPLHAIRSKILLVALLLAALAGLAGWGLVLRLLHPLERLRSQVHQIRRHRLGIEALQIERRDEIGDLSRDFYTLVAERELAETQTRDSERRLKLLTDHVPVVIVYIDREHRYQFINATFEKWFGVSAEEGMMRSISEVLGEEAYQMRAQHLRRAFAGEEVEFEFTVSDNAPDCASRGRDFQASYVPDIDDYGVVIGVYGLINEITKVKAVQSALRFAAATDTLTGIANRRRFDEHLVQTMARAQAADGQLALAYLDIDRFKSINDSLGHQAGDAVLKEFAQRLLVSVRSSDLAARLAGDEFVIVFEGIRSAAELRLIGSKIIAAIRLPFLLASGPLNVTASIGIAIHRERELTPEQLLNLADQALYQAKDQGRDGLVLIDSVV